MHGDWGRPGKFIVSFGFRRRCKRLTSSGVLCQNFPLAIVVIGETLSSFVIPGLMFFDRAIVLAIVGEAGCAC